ncbi:MAG: LPS translocon maturation chaperone LptM, partial [Aquabacterium sp.]
MLLAGLFTLATGMSGCGLKGPLYLPPGASASTATVAPPA